MKIIYLLVRSIIRDVKLVYFLIEIFDLCKFAESFTDYNTVVRVENKIGFSTS